MNVNYAVFYFSLSSLNYQIGVAALCCLICDELSVVDAEEERQEFKFVFCILLMIVKYQLLILVVRLNPAAYAPVMVYSTNHIMFKP